MRRNLTILLLLILAAPAWALYENTASQKVAVFAFDTGGSGRPGKTGDAAQITAYISQDDGATYQSNDANPTEVDATNQPGLYIFDLQTSETNGLLICISAVSSTADIEIQPLTIYTIKVPAVAGDSMDVLSISGDTTSADNLELQYDTTGLSGDTFPATQAQMSGIATGAGGLSVVASDFTLSTGSVTGGSITSTEELDGVSHVIEDAGTETDFHYEFDAGTVGNGTNVLWDGYVQSQGDSVSVYGWDWNSSSWKQVGSRSGSNGTTVLSADWTITTAMTGTGANVGLIHLRFESTDATAVGTDRILCQFTQLNQTVGYAQGAIWVDSAGPAGNELYVNGTADNPCPWANALVINAAFPSPLNRFHIANDVTVTLSAAFNDKTMFGEHYYLALDSQSINDSHITGASITGIGSAADHVVMFDCEIGAATIPPSRLVRCGIGSASGTFTAASDGQYVLVDCYSLVPGSGTPSLVFTGLGSATGINNRRWSGGASYTLDSDCVLSHEVVTGGGTTVVTGGADVEIRGITRSLTLTMSAAETVQFAGVTGPIALNGTTTADVNLYGVAATLTDNTSAATVVNKTVSRDTVNAEADTAIADADLATSGALVTAQTDLDTITGTDGVTLATAQALYAPAKAGDLMGLANDAITAAKYDESTAFPLILADTGSNKIARTGADSDTLETLSDQIDGVGGGGDATEAKQDTIIASLVDAKGTGYTSATDSLVEIRDRGDAAWTTGGGGTGSETTTYTITVAAVPVSGVEVSLYTGSNRTGLIGIQNTDDFGQTVWQLNVGTYYAWRKKAGYVWTNPYTLTVP